MILKNNWFSRNLLTLRVNKETFQVFAQSIVHLNGSGSNYEVHVQSNEMQEAISVTHVEKGQKQGGLGVSEGDMVACDWLNQLKKDQKDIKNWEAVSKRITTNVTRQAEGT